MTLLEFLVAWGVLGVVIAAVCSVILAGCGDTTNVYSPSVTAPAPLASPSPGHTITTRTWRVWDSACQRVQEITQTTDAGPVAEDWPAPLTPCVDPAKITPRVCG